MAKEVSSPHEIRLTPLDTNPVFQYLEEKTLHTFFSNVYIGRTAKFNDTTCFHFLVPDYQIWFAVGYFCCCIYG